MKNLDKTYLLIEFKAIVSQHINAEPTSADMKVLNALADFSESYFDKLIESRDSKIAGITQTSISMQEKVTKCEAKINTLLNDLNEKDKNYQYAVEANNKLHEELIVKNEQVNKLIDSCVNLIERLG